MSKNVQLRLAKVLVVLALALGAFGVSSRSAEAADTCYYYAGCEYCACREQVCMAGEEHPECGGDYYCCHWIYGNCWQNCIWY